MQELVQALQSFSEDPQVVLIGLEEAGSRRLISCHLRRHPSSFASPLPNSYSYLPQPFT